MSKQRYVLCVAMHPESLTSILIRKLKGPEFLLGKLTFPGGKLLDNEPPNVGASRELLEETAVSIPEESWVLLTQVHTSEYSLYVMGTASKEIYFAEKIEDEPVYIASLVYHSQRAKVDPHLYAPDFLDVTFLATDKLKNK